MPKYEARLDTKELDNLAKEIRNYRKNILPNKVELFVKKLADVGIRTAESRLITLDDLGNVSSLVLFEKKFDKTDGNISCLIIAQDKMLLQQAYFGKDKQVITKLVSPILMYEFGSGQKADNSHLADGVGQGTFPNQTHAFNKEGWYWQTLDGVWHHSKGIKPTQPMFFASQQMQRQIKSVAKEIRKL